MASVLACPNTNVQFILEAEASAVGIGAVSLSRMEAYSEPLGLRIGPLQNKNANTPPPKNFRAWWLSQSTNAIC